MLVKKIKPKFMGYHAVTVGKGTDEHINFLKKLTNNLQIDGQVHFIGFKEDTQLYPQALDYKILPSIDVNDVTFEGVLQALQETMIFECPVSGSKNDSIVDITDQERHYTIDAMGRDIIRI